MSSVKVYVHNSSLFLWCVSIRCTKMVSTLVKKKNANNKICKLTFCGLGEDPLQIGNFFFFTEIAKKRIMVKWQKLYLVIVYYSCGIVIVCDCLAASSP